MSRNWDATSQDNWQPIIKIGLEKYDGLFKVYIQRIEIDYDRYANSLLEIEDVETTGKMYKARIWQIWNGSNINRLYEYMKDYLGVLDEDLREFKDFKEHERT